MSFQDLGLETFYVGRGDEIARAAITPLLLQSESYDRISSYFSLNSFLAISSGIEAILQRKGRIRVIMGLHDVNHEIAAAVKVSRTPDFEQYLEEIQTRLLKQLSSLSDEMTKNKIYTFAMMLKEGRVELKIANLRSGQGSAIFHNKRFIFRDAAGQIVSGVGGMNETVMGLTRNYDELTLSFSWESNKHTVMAHVQNFEDLWQGSIDDVEVRELEDEFIAQVVEATRTRSLRTSHSNEQAGLRRLKGLMSKSTEYFFHSLPNVTLFPHQERVVKDVMARAPVKKMLADEVGLGKTLEAGAILKYLSNLDPNSTSIIVCPKNLMNQWRDEMAKHFDLEYWNWIPSERRFESIRGASWPSTSGFPFEDDRPQRIVISRNLLATERYRNYISDLENLIFDTLVFDESHAARISRDLSGKLTRSKTWHVAKALTSSSKNCLLLTATPMQLEVSELYGQLTLLGLPESWDRPDVFEESIRLLAAFPDELSLDEARILGELIRDAAATEVEGRIGDTHEAAFLEKLRRCDDVLELSLLIRANRETARSVFLRSHPAHNLVVRNTRQSLQEIGYKFPRRVHHAPEMSSTGQLGSYLQILKNYLAHEYGKVEAAISPSNGGGGGLAISTYWQRVSSSLVASRLTLQKRRSRLIELKKLLDSPDMAESKYTFINPGFEDDEELDFDPDLSLDDSIIQAADEDLGPSKHLILHAIQTETIAIKQVIDKLDELQSDPDFIDPKFKTALEIIEREIPYGPVVLFSKYTDTLFGFLDYLESRRPDLATNELGFYTGSSVWLSIEGHQELSNKSAVVQAVFSGRIKVLLCSDAASEGLNLQASGVVVNIDVPWNPARLEQRIGRIDRLGQKRDEVKIYNLWYPDSVEAEMYSRLLSRKDLMEVAVGRYPTLVADSISAAVAERLGRTTETRRKKDDLELYRDRAQELSLEKIWSQSEGRTTTSRQVRSQVMDVFAGQPGTKHLVEGLVLEEGNPKTFDLLHPNLDGWWEGPSPTSGSGELLAATAHGEILLGLCIETATSIYVVEQEDLADLFASILGTEKYPIRVAGGETQFESGQTGKLKAYQFLAAKVPPAFSTIHAEPSEYTFENLGIWVEMMHAD